MREELIKFIEWYDANLQAHGGKAADIVDSYIADEKEEEEFQCLNKYKKVWKKLGDN